MVEDTGLEMRRPPYCVVLCYPNLEWFRRASRPFSVRDWHPLSLTMKSMSCTVSGTIVGAGASALFFAFQWIFAILEPSGKGLPFPGTPA